jgi:riboflavin kinase/FMN adenylyltransferase
MLRIASMERFCLITAYSLDTLIPLPLPVALTIGTFDGVHLGHRYLLTELKKYGTSVALTFSNHPAEILSPTPPRLISTLSEKLALFKECGLDCAIVLTFTQDLANQSYDVFLKKLKFCTSFSTLVIGKGAAFGKYNEGTETRIKALEASLGFKSYYLEKMVSEKDCISSNIIRNLIHQGDLSKAAKLLGRTYLKKD